MKIWINIDLAVDTLTSRILEAINDKEHRDIVNIAQLNEMELHSLINATLCEQVLGDSDTPEIVEGDAIVYDTTCPRGCPPFVCYGGSNENCSYRSPIEKGGER